MEPSHPPGEKINFGENSASLERKFSFSAENSS
jgi:hypothetical protein